jgi:hypothetical protein
LPEAETAQRALVERLDRAPGGTVLVTIGAGSVFELGEALVTEPVGALEGAG